MKALSFLTYSALAVVRNRRRSIYAIAGIALSTALIAGSLIAVDLSATGLLRSSISSTVVDFTGEDFTYPSWGLNRSDYDAGVNAIHWVPGVSEASYWVTSDDWTLENGAGREYLSYAGGSYLAFVSSESHKLLERNGIQGAVPAPGTVAISQSAADDLGVSVGGNIVCSLSEFTSMVSPKSGTRFIGVAFLNLTFPVSQIWTQKKAASDYVADRPDLQDDKVVYLNGKGGVEPVVLNIQSLETVMNQTVFHYMATYGHPFPALRYLIWTDQSSVINIGDLRGSVAKLEVMQARLDKVGEEYHFVVGDSPLQNQLDLLGRDLDSTKMLYVEMSLPVAALGVYLSVVGVDMGVSSRSREAGILRARGASGKLVFVYLALEAAILGALASLIGLSMSLVVSALLFRSAPSVSSTTSAFGSLSSVPMIDTTTIELAMAFGVGLMFLSSYGSFRKVSDLAVREAIHNYSPTVARDDYSSSADVVLIGFSVLSIASVLVTVNAVQGRGWPWLAELAVGLVLTWGVLLFPFVPFFLSFSIVRILTRGWRRIYSKFAVFVRPWTRELHYLVEKSLLRNPRRASNLGVLISLALASGLFVSVTMESSMANQRHQVMFDYGSDIKVEGQWFGSDMSPGRQLNISQLSGLESIQGVRDSLSYELLTVQPFPYASGSDVRAAVIDFSEYSRLMSMSGNSLSGRGHGALADLETNGTAVVSSQFLESNYLEVGESLKFDFYHYTWDNGLLVRNSSKFPLRIAGVIDGLPGLSSADIVVDARTMAWLTSRDISAAPMMVNSFIALSKGTDPHAVEPVVKSVYARAGVEPRVSVAADGIAAIKQERGFGVMQGFLYMEYVLSVAILSVGVGLLVFVSVEDRERELACTSARGLSGSQMRRMLMGESFTLMLLGLVVGVSVGLTAAYLFNTMPPSTTLVPKTMEFTAVSWMMLLISVASLVLSSLLATARAGKMRLAEILRIRGG